MGKHNWTVCDWIIYFSEDGIGSQVKVCAVGSAQARTAHGTVLKGFTGTYPEAKQMAADLLTEYAPKWKSHYVRRSKDDRN